MPPSNHALLGASSAHRWLACTPSVKWEQHFPEPKTSEAAEEGTLAHAVAEEHMRQLLAGKKVRTSAKLKKNPLYRPVMEEHVATYTSHLMEIYNEVLQRTPDALMLLEERVDYSDWVPEGFGTSDAILIADDVMHIFDFKYGKGIPVDAEGNPQMRLYALGALAGFDGLYDIREVVTHIIQPRLDSITHEKLAASALMHWGEAFVKPRAQLAWEGKGTHEAGEHCRFCRCKNVCRFYAMKQLEMESIQLDTSTNEPREPWELSNEEIAKVLLGVDELTRWAKSVKDYALEQALHHGEVFPGFKVVEGRANRIISKPDDALSLLEQAGWETQDITRLISLSDLEELVGKKALSELLGDLIVKPAGKPVLAKEDDKRPAISSEAKAQGVFKPLD